MIGAVLVPGAKAPRLVSNSLVAHMKPGAVLVDIAIDQGGCFEDSRPTTHDHPTFAVHDTLFYCVANMPSAVPKTSTFALTNATMPYVLKLADHGWQAACRSDPALAKVFRPTMARCCPNRWPTTWVCRSPTAACWPELAASALVVSGEAGDDIGRRPGLRLRERRSRPEGHPVRVFRVGRRLPDRQRHLVDLRIAQRRHVDRACG